MSVIAAIILGLVQGLTEFIPVSSSGHMLLASRIFNLPSNFKFDVILNIGTLLALVLYYWRTIWEVVLDIVKNNNWSLAIKLVIGTIPVVVVGYTFQSAIENKLQSVWIVVFMLALVGVVMLLSERLVRGKPMEKLTRFGALRIGLVQVISLIPGTSRSGVTILAGEREGLTAREAARFSFLLAIPTILGATLKVMAGHEGRSFISSNLAVVLIGNIVSFVAGAFAIRFLINLLGKYGLKPFGWYRIGLSALLIVLLFARII